MLVVDSDDCFLDKAIFTLLKLWSSQTPFNQRSPGAEMVAHWCAITPVSFPKRQLSTITNAYYFNCAVDLVRVPIRSCSKGRS